MVCGTNFGYDKKTDCISAFSSGINDDDVYAARYRKYRGRTEKDPAYMGSHCKIDGILMFCVMCFQYRTVDHGCNQKQLPDPRSAYKCRD